MDSTLASMEDLVASETTDYNENVQLKNHCTECENEASLNLLDLHEEILRHIFHYIDAEHLLDSVANVCTCLRRLLTNEIYWKLRLFEAFPKPYPVVNVSTFSWPEACKARESCKERWKDGLDKKKIILNKSHGSAIDCVHIIQNNSLCICGGRDRSIIVWKVDEDSISTAEALDTPTIKETCSLYQHKGWVWSISSYGDEFCTTSFDSTVKFWDIGSLTSGKEKLSVHINSAILCSAYINSNSMVAGCYNKKSVILDNRCSRVCEEFINHERAVLCVSSNDNIIASTGEDGLIILTDIRTFKILRKIRKRSFYLSMDHCGEQIWVGAKNGTIGVYNLQYSSDMKLMANFNYEFNGKITGLRYTPGAVYAGCTDGWLKIYEPCFEPEMIAGQQLEAKGVTDLSLCDDMLAVSTADGLVALWHP